MIMVPFFVDVPIEKSTGWVHSTYTYDAPSGVLKAFIDGDLITQVTISNWQAKGTSGAYELDFNFLAY